MNAFFKGIGFAVALAVFGFAGRASAACNVDTDCSGSTCGGDVCQWGSSGHKCVAAGTDAQGSDGWCNVTNDCKCEGEGATCVANHCTFTLPKDGGSAGAAGSGNGGSAGSGTAGAGGSAGSSMGGSAGSSMGGSAGSSTGGSAGSSTGGSAGSSTGGSSNAKSSSKSSGCGCRVAGHSGSSSEALALAALGALMLLRRRREDED